MDLSSQVGLRLLYHRRCGAGDVVVGGMDLSSQVGLRLLVLKCEDEREFVIGGMDLSSQVGLRLNDHGRDRGAVFVRRNGPEQSGGIATSLSSQATPPIRVGGMDLSSQVGLRPGRRLPPEALHHWEEWT